MSSRQLLEAFHNWRQEGESLVLASVYETSGSTYSKVGARMLITADGRFQGMLSGGCLEGDLAERAKLALQTGIPSAVTYDLGKGDDELWGLGVGCDGMMRIFLQPMPAMQGYEPFTSMTRAFEDDVKWVAATVIESACASLAVGATLLTNGTETEAHEIEGAAVKVIAAAASKVLDGAKSLCSKMTFVDGEATVLFGMLTPPPRLLVLGGGLDAIPLVTMANELGWLVTVADHRPAYLANERFADAQETHCAPVETITEHVELDSFQFAIVMSHHLLSDRSYLRQLADTAVPYIGLLGPPARRERLLNELNDHGDAIRDRLHGPAGLDIGGDDPASIALSILAQMHQVLKLR